MLDHDLSTMRIALAEAQAAADAGETPVGAVVVDPSSGEIVARAYNRPIGLNDPTAHAEILALRAAAKAVGNYRLSGLELFVTLEPCAMCAGAIIHGPRFFNQPTCHWRPEVTGGVLGEESAVLLRGFFKTRRG